MHGCLMTFGGTSVVCNPPENHVLQPKLPSVIDGIPRVSILDQGILSLDLGDQRSFEDVPVLLMHSAFDNIVDSLRGHPNSPST